jgi:hypothetical protein
LVVARVSRRGLAAERAARPRKRMFLMSMVEPVLNESGGKVVD